ncbi:MAG: Sir2 family NAD-dependent protein deacetylase [Planctomycetota bacterium]
MIESLQQAANYIANADAILIGAGAGIGVDSGLPDFRGNEGFWNAYPPFRKLGLSFSDLADPIWFHRNPHQAWGFYGHRLNLYRSTIPHLGFSIMRRWSANLFAFTSNVDGQFQKAGFDEKQIMECHGSIHHLQCVEPCCDEIWAAEGVEVDVDEETFLAKDPLPKCRYCEAIARPNILMFGDAGWLTGRTSDQTDRFSRWLGHIGDRSLVSIELGAGTAIPSVRMEMEDQTRGRRGVLIRINPRESECEDGISIATGALEAIEKLDGLIESPS